MGQKTIVKSIKWKVKENIDINARNGVYFLQTSLKEQNEEVLWRFYNTIREIEASFRVLKTDLDLRPIYHKSDSATMAHLHLGLLAYWVVNTIRFQLKSKGVNSKTKEVIFYQKFPLGTNNIGEFLALVHGISYVQQKGLNIPIYTDSKTAMSWISKKKCGSKLEPIGDTQKLFELVERAEKWLQNNIITAKILKWDTKSWGEIPADFGRK